MTITITVAFGLAMVIGAGRLFYLAARRVKRARERLAWMKLIATASADAGRRAGHGGDTGTDPHRHSNHW